MGSGCAGEAGILVFCFLGEQNDGFVRSPISHMDVNSKYVPSQLDLSRKKAPLGHLI